MQFQSLSPCVALKLVLYLFCFLRRGICSVVPNPDENDVEEGCEVADRHLAVAEP